MTINTIYQGESHSAKTSGTVAGHQASTKITKLAFKNRMTSVERIAIRAAAESDPVIYDFMDLVSDATFIDLARPDTQIGVNYLETQGHLAAGRANEILTNPIVEDEMPQNLN